MKNNNNNNREGKWLRIDALWKEKVANGITADGLCGLLWKSKIKSNKNPFVFLKRKEKYIGQFLAFFFFFFLRKWLWSNSEIERIFFKGPLCSPCRNSLPPHLCQSFPSAVMSTLQSLKAICCLVARWECGWTRRENKTTRTKQLIRLLVKRKRKLYCVL